MTFRAVRFASIATMISLAAFGLAFGEEPSQARSEAKPAAGPSHQVIACYFHRTVRCPTCQRIGTYVEESVKAGFAPQLKDGRVKIMFMDFQDVKNQKYTQAYRISGPTLVVMDVKDGKVASWKPAPKVWSLVGQKDEFFKYVRGEVQGYLDEKATASR